MFIVSFASSSGRGGDLSAKSSAFKDRESAVKSVLESVREVYGEYPPTEDEWKDIEKSVRSSGNLEIPYDENPSEYDYVWKIDEFDFRE